MAIRYRKDGSWEDYPNLSVRGEDGWLHTKYLFGSEGPVLVYPDDPRFPWEPGEPKNPGTPPRIITPWKVLKAFVPPDRQPSGAPFVEITRADPAYQDLPGGYPPGYPWPAPDTVLVSWEQKPEGIIEDSWARLLIFNVNGEEFLEVIHDPDQTHWEMEWPFPTGYLTVRYCYINEVGRGPLSAASPEERVFGEWDPTNPWPFPL